MKFKLFETKNEVDSMRTSIKFSGILIFLLAVLFVLPANAALQAVGPASSADGFPVWYQDTNGLRLEPCLANATGLGDPFCVLPLVPPLEPNFDPALPVVFPTNYPSELFFWIADSDVMSVGPTGAGKAILRMALEGAFASADGNPAPNQQITFLRINLKKMSGLTPNSTYTVTYPFGTFQFTTDAAGDTVIATAGQAFRTEDSSFIPGDFASLLPATTTGIGPFLTDAAMPAGGFALDPANPAARYIGDAVTPVPITPGPNGAVFIIDGPNIGGPGVNTKQTNLWVVSGRFFGGAGNVTGFKINDQNSNGIQDAGEGFVPGWNITIRNDATGVAINGATDTTGFYRFNAIRPGNYTVTEEVKAGWVNTTPVSKAVTVADAQTAIANFTNVLLAQRGVDLLVDGARTAARITTSNTNATYVLTVTNIGHLPDTFNLTIQNPQNAVAGLDISSIALDAGMSGTALLNVTSAVPGSFVVNVTSTSQADATVGATISTTTRISGLKAVSPVNGSDGFPLWYMDANGLPLEPCLANATGLGDPNCVLPLVPPLEPNFDPNLTVAFPGNYPSELFYWIADSDVMNVGPTGTGKAILRMALEGAFASATGLPEAGQQITFLRVNLKKMSGLTPDSTYTVTYPFGTFQFTTDALGDTVIGTAGQAFRAEDSSFIPGDFASLLPATTTGIGPFLTWTGIPPAGLALDPADPAAHYIGDPAVPHTITAGPNGAFFRIDGPNIGGPGVNTIQIDQWFIAGKILAGTVILNGTITGTVTDVSTGAAIAGATVTAGGITATTSAAGAYTISIAPSTYTVTASVPGFTASTVSVTVISGQTVSQNFALAPIIVIVNGTIAGTVTDATTGAAIAGAAVTAGSMTATTDAAGGYSISIAPGTYTVTAGAAGHVAQSVAGVVVTSGATTVQNFALNPVPVANGTITGTVTDASTGTAITGAAVTAGSMTGTTDAAGGYSISIAPGTYTVTASAAGHVAQSVAGVVVTSGVTTVQNFALAPIIVIVNGTITGTVTDASTRAGIAGATVTAGSVTAITDAAGVYTISIAPGTYTVTASAAGHDPASASVTVRSGVTVKQNFALAPIPVTLTFIVTDSNTNLPISGATVKSGGSFAGTTNALGVVTFQVAPGVYTYDVRMAGFLRVRATVTLAGDTTIPVKLTPRR